MEFKYKKINENPIARGQWMNYKCRIGYLPWSGGCIIVVVIGLLGNSSTVSESSDPQGTYMIEFVWDGECYLTKH